MVDGPQQTKGDCRNGLYGHVVRVSIVSDARTSHGRTKGPAVQLDC